MDPAIPKYLLIGGGFGIRPGLTKDYVGAVIASADAFYLIPYINMNTAALFGALGGIGGAVGGLLAAGALGASGALNSSATARNAFAAALTDDVTGHTDWPKKVRAKQGIVVPRVAITSIKYNFWGHFNLITELNTFKLEISMIRRRRIIATLRAWTWQF